MAYAFDPAATPSLPISGSDALFPVHRIYCVGRNYAEHAKEMGAVADRETPTFFSKPADALLPLGGEFPYPLRTTDLHHEVELVIALGSGGESIALRRALDCVYGYAVGVDLTRRDLQAKAKAKGLPWDTAKGFDRSAPVSALRPASEIGHPRQGRIWLDVNDQRRQEADIGDMIFSVAEIVQELSHLYELKAGDLIFTGTPAGVGALNAGDRFSCGIEGIAELEGKVLARS